MSERLDNKARCRLLENHFGTAQLRWPVRWDKGDRPQDAHKGQTSHTPNPGAPRRAIPLARPQRVKRRGGTYRNSCEPFAL